MRRNGDQDGQQAAPEKPNSEQPAAPIRRDRAGHDVVVGHRHDAADEGIDGPQDEKDGHHRLPGQFRPEPQETGQRRKAYGASESTRHVKRHSAGASLRDVTDDELRH